MARYDQVYDRLAERAVENGIRDMLSFIRGLEEERVPTATIERLLIEDLETSGPVFGKFLRDIGVAASSSVRAAFDQGTSLGVIDGSAELLRALSAAGRVESLQKAVEDGDPEAAEVLGEEFLDHIEHRWVAVLVNTCPICLPLHGREMTLDQWRERGLVPGDTMHPNCRCTLVPSHTVPSRDDLLSPLRRAKVDEPGSRKTARRVSQADLDRAIEARDQALKTEAGRKVLARLGRVNA